LCKCKYFLGSKIIENFRLGLRKRLFLGDEIEPRKKAENASGFYRCKAHGCLDLSKTCF